VGYLEKAIDIRDTGSSNLHVIYGKSQSGKTNLLGTYPKPMYYVEIGDDGTGTIKHRKGIRWLKADTVSKLKAILNEMIDKLDTIKAKSIVIDTFSLLVEEWTDENAVKKSRKMTQNMWGELKTETQELIKLAKILAQKKIVVLTCHEAKDETEGYEDEIVPEVRPSVSKGARTYLEGMANLGIHTTIVLKEVEEEEGMVVEKSAYAAHIGPNPFYWTKTQKNPKIEMPEYIFNPTYKKIMSLIKPSEEGE
jgi:hypothetical protein